MTLSQQAIEAMMAAQTDAVVLVVVDITHPELAQPLRLVRNTQQIVRNGNVYLPFAFELDLPSDNDDMPQVQFRFDNVEREIVDAIRECPSPPTFTLAVILASNPNYTEAGPYVMTMVEADYNAREVTGTLAFEDVLNEPYPGLSITPANFPGMF